MTVPRSPQRVTARRQDVLDLIRASVFVAAMLGSLFFYALVA